MNEAFLSKVLSYIKNPFIKNKIRKELENHLLDKVEDLVLDGIEREEAEKIAVESMGSAEIMGKELNAVHNPFLSYFVLFAQFLAITALLLMIFQIIVPGLGIMKDRYQKNKFSSQEMAANMYGDKDFSQSIISNQEINFTVEDYRLKEILYSNEHNDILLIFNKKFSLIPSAFPEHTKAYFIDAKCPENECYYNVMIGNGFVLDVREIKNQEYLIFELDTGLKKHSYTIDLEGLHE